MWHGSRCGCIGDLLAIRNAYGQGVEHAGLVIARVVFAKRRNVRDCCANEIKRNRGRLSSSTPFPDFSAGAKRHAVSLATQASPQEKD
jgi:hypothetical protein